MVKDFISFNFINYNTTTINYNLVKQDTNIMGLNLVDNQQAKIIIIMVKANKVNIRVKADIMAKVDIMVKVDIIIRAATIIMPTNNYFKDILRKSK